MASLLAAAGGRFPNPQQVSLPGPHPSPVSVEWPDWSYLSINSMTSRSPEKEATYFLSSVLSLTCPFCSLGVSSPVSDRARPPSKG